MIKIHERRSKFIGPLLVWRRAKLINMRYHLKKIEGIIQQDCLEMVGEIIHIEALFPFNFKHKLVVNKCNDGFGSSVLKFET